MMLLYIKFETEEHKESGEMFKRNVMEVSPHSSECI